MPVKIVHAADFHLDSPFAGLSPEQAGRFPHEFSGGQRQRVGIARAIANNPKYLIADEPTGNLDTRTSDEIMALFAKINAAGNTVVLVTHEEDVAECAGRIVRLRDGRICSGC